MLLPPPDGFDRAQALAAKLGCTVQVCVTATETASSHAQPALLGSTASFASTLSEFGARFDEQEKVYVFSNWPTLEAALQHVLEQRRLNNP